MGLTQGALESECIETFKECVILSIHIKMFKAFIDSTVRYGKHEDFLLSFLLSDRQKETKLRERMIKKFAEPDKVDYYGTKEVFKDSEDYFPYVYVPFYLELPSK